MAEGRKRKRIPSMYADEQVMAWMQEHVTQLRHSVYGQRILYWSLAICFVAGLAAHIGGYTLRSAVPDGFPWLSADLLYALGWSLWTGVVVALFRSGHTGGEIISRSRRRRSRSCGPRIFGRMWAPASGASLRCCPHVSTIRQLSTGVREP